MPNQGSGLCLPEVVGPIVWSQTFWFFVPVSSCLLLPYFDKSRNCEAGWIIIWKIGVHVKSNFIFSNFLRTICYNIWKSNLFNLRLNDLIVLIMLRVLLYLKYMKFLSYKYFYNNFHGLIKILLWIFTFFPPKITSMDSNSQYGKPSIKL